MIIACRLMLAKDSKVGNSNVFLVIYPPHIIPNISLLLVKIYHTLLNRK